ncbi:MAG: hypothetical protein KatS3mg113_0655 [Planctomycetaceae bacterium]|nr:MAG: hypothetical protein KatS3mg113_0655 [Planctomycetaceae bacterium]
MSRIFLTLCGLGNLLLITAFAVGLPIDDPRIADQAIQLQVSRHMLLGLAALCFATLVHALVFTYFMGTGRWLEETSQAYRLEQHFHQRNQRTKYRLLPGIVGSFLLMLATGALGAAADPGSPVQFTGWWGIPAATWHRGCALLTIVANLAQSYLEFLALYENGEIVQAVLSEVRRIRIEKGLAVD